MVGPSTPAERDLNRKRVVAGLVGVVALSAVLSGLYAGATPVELVLLGGFGSLTGIALSVAIGLQWPTDR